MKRYDLATVHLAGQSPRGEMQESDEGEYVLFEDYSQHVDRLQKLIDILKETVEISNMQLRLARAGSLLSS